MADVSKVNVNSTDYDIKDSNAMHKGVDRVTAGQYSGAVLGYCATSEGQATRATGNTSHAQGMGTESAASYSHSEGYDTHVLAGADAGHAEGYGVVVSGRSAHGQGYGTLASSDYQHVEGKWNVEDANDTYAHIIGGGTANNARKNIFTVDWNGDVNAGRSNGLTNDTKLPTGADVISYLNSNLVPNTTRMLSLGSITGTATDAKTILINAFNAINVYGTVITGSFLNAGVWIFIGFKYTGGQYGMLIATKYSTTKMIYTLHVIDGTVYASSITGTAL